MIKRISGQEPNWRPAEVMSSTMQKNLPGLSFLGIELMQDPAHGALGIVTFGDPKPGGSTSEGTPRCGIGMHKNSGIWIGRRTAKLRRQVVRMCYDSDVPALEEMPWGEQEERKKALYELVMDSLRKLVGRKVTDAGTIDLNGGQPLAVVFEPDEECGDERVVAFSGGLTWLVMGLSG